MGAVVCRPERRAASIRMPTPLPAGRGGTALLLPQRDCPLRVPHRRRPARKRVLTLFNDVSPSVPHIRRGGGPARPPAIGSREGAVRPSTDVCPACPSVASAVRRSFRPSGFRCEETESGVSKPVSVSPRIQPNDQASHRRQRQGAPARSLRNPRVWGTGTCQSPFGDRSRDGARATSCGPRARPRRTLSNLLRQVRAAVFDHRS